jgi:hypothetical protein
VKLVVTDIDECKEKTASVNAKNANAKTYGETMSAAAVEACFT